MIFPPRSYLYFFLQNQNWETPVIWLKAQIIHQPEKTRSSLCDISNLSSGQEILILYHPVWILLNGLKSIWWIVNCCQCLSILKPILICASVKLWKACDCKRFIFMYVIHINYSACCLHDELYKNNSSVVHTSIQNMMGVLAIKLSRGLAPPQNHDSPKRASKVYVSPSWKPEREEQQLAAHAIANCHTPPHHTWPRCPNCCVEKWAQVWVCLACAGGVVEVEVCKGTLQVGA